MEFLEHWPLLFLLLCVSGIAFSYLVYPILIFGLSRLFGRPSLTRPLAEEELPQMSLLISAFNEGRIIRQRIENALALDYPKDKLTIVICSDGSTDDTDEIVASYADEYPDLVKFYSNSVNQGKASVLNEIIPLLESEILVLSDANTAMRPDSLKSMASWFAQKDVGVVCGRLILYDCVNGNNADGVYWKYETFLKKCESRLGALLGSNGGIYALRRDLFPGVPPGTIIDDFYIPLEIKRRSGCRIVYDTQAIASEETAASIGAEFHRRSRIGAGGFQSIGLLWRLLSPAHGWVSFAFLSHKVLRWLCPFLMVFAFVSNALILDTLVGQALFALQLAGYGLAAVGPWIPNKPKVMKLLRLPAMFVSMNAALFVGFFKWAFKRQAGTWACTDRKLAHFEFAGAIHGEPTP
jgi:cellulose synthase/poly-beta-1,6-N-acetylglucosamine synthase-like glycosyltransferase